MLTKIPAPPIAGAWHPSLAKRTASALVAVTLCLSLSAFWPGLAAAADTAQYTYDSADRLIQAMQTDGSVQDYVYDGLGNRLMVTTTLPGGLSNHPPSSVTNPNIPNGTVNVAI